MSMAGSTCRKKSGQSGWKRLWSGLWKTAAEKGLTEQASDAYVVERMKRIGQRTAWALLEQLKKGTFLPEQTEVSFRNLEQLSSVSLLLSEEERMRLQGRIDRIDVCGRRGTSMSGSSITRAALSGLI